MKKLLFLLLALSLFTTACNDRHDLLDSDPYYWGPTGTPGPPAGPDEDHCDGC